MIASDVDGTLLDDDEKITARTREAVHAAVDSGAQFVLATGRPARWVQPVVDALGLAPMAVCANGAVIYDPSTDRIVSARTLSTDALGELAEIATRVIPGAGLAVERVGESAHDAATPQFVSSPGYEHAWLRTVSPAITQPLIHSPAWNRRFAGSAAGRPSVRCALLEIACTYCTAPYSREMDRDTTAKRPSISSRRSCRSGQVSAVISISRHDSASAFAPT